MNNIETQDTTFAALPSRQERVLQILRDIAAIKAQLDRAKVRFAASGKYDDPEWFVAASAALRFKQVEHQRLLLEVSAERNGASRVQPDQSSLNAPTFDSSMLLQRDEGSTGTQAGPSLHEKALAVLQDLAAIKAQLDRARRRVHEGKGYSDSVWFHAANTALKYKQVQHQRLMREIGDQQKNAKAARVAREQQLQSTFERTFIRTARDLLDKETYVQLLRETERRTTAGPVELAGQAGRADGADQEQAEEEGEDAEVCSGPRG